MDIKRFEESGRMSIAVTHNKTLYLSGQTCKERGKDIYEQTNIVLGKVESLLNKYDSNKECILSAVIYLRDIKDYESMNEIWDKWVVSGHEPVRACVEARMALDTILVEVSIVSAIK